MSETRTIIEGKWDCRDCATRDIPGREKQCPQCGSPREAGKESEFRFDENGPGVTDEKAKALAGAGADWFCASCGTANRGDQTTCRNCQSTRDAKAKVNATGEISASPLPSVSIAPKKPGRGKWIGFGIVGAIAGGVAMWGTSTHAVRGEVSALSWKRHRIVETFTRGVGGGWRDEISPHAPRMPTHGQGEDGGAENIRDCLTKYRKTVQVSCGTRHVCKTVSVQKACGTEQSCSTHNKGNGFAERVCRDVTKYCTGSEERCSDETQYCDHRVDGQWCTYDRFAWSPVFDQTLSGADAQPRWPERPLQVLDRDQRTAEYTARVRYTVKGRAEEAEWKISDEKQFEALAPGAPIALELKNWGGLVSFTPVVR